MTLITPNVLSYFRIALAIAILVLLILQRTLPAEIIAFIGFTIAVITDWYDGHLARTKSLVSDMGKIIDPIADKLLIIGVLSIFVFYRLYPIWWVVLIFTRELVVTGVRFHLLSKGRVVPAERAGKWKVGFQIGSVYLTFFYLIALDSGVSYISFLKALHFMGIFLANLLTVYSGISFFQNLWRSNG